METWVESGLDVLYGNLCLITPPTALRPLNAIYVYYGPTYGFYFLLHIS